MTRHCQNCGKTMRHFKRTFSRPGGYHCINRACPNSRLYWYRSINGELVSGALRAYRLKAVID